MVVTRESCYSQKGNGKSDYVLHDVFLLLNKRRTYRNASGSKQKRMLETELDAGIESEHERILSAVR